MGAEPRGVVLTRRAYWLLHRRIGLVAALFALIVSLSGVALLFRAELREPLPRAPAVTVPSRLDLIVERAVRFGGAPATDITLPSAASEPYQVWLDDEDETLVFLDGKGRVLGSRASRRGLTRMIFDLHTGAWLGGFGTLLSGLLGLTLVA
ncbi:MAG TPA: hypothetical protein ENK31_09445, partial [Nannocystis exedens]|nr:hypothetical protein [Nannocystis exedens]